MKKIFKFLCMILLLIIGISSITGCKSKTLDDVMTDYIDELIEDTDSFIPSWNKESFKGKWNYIDGVFLNSIVTLYYDLKDIDEEKANFYKEFFLRYINYYLNDSGYFQNLKDYSQAYRSGELDTVCESKILFDAYEITKDKKYLTGIDVTYNELLSIPRAEGTYNFSHKVTYLNQVWLDGMYMYGPFYARYALATNNNDIFTELKGQYEYIRNNMFDEEKKLYYHGHDTTKSIYWANKETGCSQSFWLRSIGWYLVSLCDVLDYYPEGEEKTYLINLLKEGLDGILQYQDQESKMFYQVVDQGPITVNVDYSYLEGLKNKDYMKNGEYVNTDITNYLESSGSSMMAYALIKAANNGYVDQTYRQKGIEVFEGVYNYSFKNNSLSNICITAGLGPGSNPYRDGSISYYLAEPVGSNDAKGVGPFIMVYLEYTYGTTRTSKIPTPTIK